MLIWGIRKFCPIQCTALISFVSNLNSQFRTWCARKAFNTVFLSKITEISSSHCTTSVIRKEHTYHNRDSSVGTANQYELEGLGIESRWEARPSAPIQTAPGAHQASYTMGTGSFSGVTSRTRFMFLLLYDGYRVFPGGTAAGTWHWLPTSM